jgi:hypothetical protein
MYEELNHSVFGRFPENQWIFVIFSEIFTELLVNVKMKDFLEGSEEFSQFSRCHKINAYFYACLKVLELPCYL